MKHNYLSNALVGITFSFISIGIIMIFYMLWLLLGPIPDYHYNNIPFATDKVVKAGSLIHISIDYCKTDNHILKVYGQLEETYNHTLIQVGSKDRNLPMGCHNTVSYIWRIPPETPPGNYVYQFNIVDQVNSLRVVNYTSYTQPFQVVK